MQCRRERASMVSAIIVGLLLLPWFGYAAEPSPAIQINKGVAPQVPPDPSLTRLTLQDAERIALDNHPRIRAANERVKVQRATVGRSKSAYYPSLVFRSLYETTTAAGQTTTTEDGFDFYSK